MYRFWLPLPCEKQAPRRRSRKIKSDIPEIRALQAACYCETPLQFAAVRLAVYGGLNVFPTLYGEKGGTPWRFMQYTRLNIEDLPEIFKEPCNIAVMTGATSGNLCVIDAETDQRFNWFVQQFEQHGIPVVAQRSGKPGGGGHIFVRCAEGEVANMPKNHGRHDWELRGNRNYVLVAPSLHPCGTTYEWTHGGFKEIPIVSINDLSFIHATLHTTEQTVHRIVDDLGNLSSRTRDFMQCGAQVGERNYRLYIAGCDANGCGNSFDWAWKHLGAMAMVSGLSEQESRRTLNSAYSQPRQPARLLASKHKQPKWLRALIWALSRRWEGRSGASLRAVFIALCRRMKTANKEDVFRASNREVAELAHLHVETANKTLHKLEDTGLVSRTGRDRSSEAFTYRLPREITRQPQTTDSETPNTHIAPSWGGDTVRTLQNLLDSDLIEQQALGQNAVILLAHMLRLRRGLSVERWAQESFLTRSQVYYVLPRLVETGLVAKDGSIYAAAPIEVEIAEGEIAASAGTLGKSAVRRERHMQQRARYAMKRLVKALRARTCAWLLGSEEQAKDGQLLLPIAHNRI